MKPRRDNPEPDVIDAFLGWACVGRAGRALEPPPKCFTGVVCTMASGIRVGLFVPRGSREIPRFAWRPHRNMVTYADLPPGSPGQEPPARRSNYGPGPLQFGELR